MPYFIDSSALIKRYHYETGTEVIDEIIEKEYSQIFISSVTLIEVIATLRRKVKERKISKNRFLKLKGVFLYDVEKMYTLIPLDDSVLADALHIAEKYGCKSLDSLQLSSALKAKLIEGEIIFVCADKQLLKYAKKEGFETLNPENV